MSDQVASAGWYPDSTRPGYHRWWDGQAWTDNLQPSVPEQPAASEAATMAVPEIADSAPAADSATVAVPGGFDQALELDSATVAVPYQDDQSGPDSSTIAVPHQAGGPSGPESSTVVVQPGSATPPGFAAPSYQPEGYQPGGQVPPAGGPPSFGQPGFGATGQPSGFQPQPQGGGFAPNPQFVAGAPDHAGFQPSPQVEARSVPTVFLLLGAVGLILTIVGSVLPWATVQSVASDRTENVSGIAGVDGRVIIGLAVLGLVGVLLGFMGKRLGGFLLLVAGLAAVIIAVIDVIGISGIDEATFTSELGPGLFVVIVGGIMATLGGLISALR